MRKEIKLLTTIAVTFLLGLPASASECTNTTWNKILERGEIAIGVKADYKPWGFLSPDGNLIGMEPDMARDIANTMGVKLKLVATPGASRVPFLETGKIDMVLATWSDTADRRKIAGIVLPDYYSSGTNVMAPKELNLKSWEDLRGKPVCGKQGAFYNEKVRQKYGAKIISFLNRAEGLQALRDKKCIAFLNDDSSIIVDLNSGDWPGFEMPLKTEDATPWALAVPIEERNCIFGRFMSGMLYNWLRDGRLIELEAKWGIKPSSAFLGKKKELYKDFLDGAGLSLSGAYSSAK